MIGFYAAGAMGGGPTSVRIDAVTTSPAPVSTSISWSHTCSGDNRYLQVAISFPSSPVGASTVTYNGASLTRIFADTQGNRSLEVWALVAPAAGTHSIAITLPSAATNNDVGATARSFRNVDQSAPVRDSGSGKAGTGTSVTTSVTAAAGDLVVDALCLRTASAQVANVNQGAGQTRDSRFNAGGANAVVSATSRKRGTGSVSMSWSWVGNDNHIHYAAALAPAA